MVGHNAPSPCNSAPGQSEPDLEYGFDDPDVLTDQEKRGLSQQGRNRDPSPAEIAEACAEIRKGWSKGEHRIRAGLAPADNYGRDQMHRELNRNGYVRGWTPPVCRDFTVGKGVR